MRALVRFFTGVTPLATALSGLLVTGLGEAGWWLAVRAILFVAPPTGAQLGFSAPGDPVIHRALAAFACALPAALGWTVAAVRGARRDEPSGVVTLTICTAPILCAAATATLARMLIMRAAWSRVLAQPNGLTPLISISELDYFSWGIWAALLTTIALMVNLLRK